MKFTPLASKLYFPPSRHNIVPRPRLLERLSQGLQGPLTLITAPAGYGKTTLMGEWHANQSKSIPVAWLSLDASDNDPARFWYYVITALDALQSGIGNDVLTFLESPPLPPLENLLTFLINDLNTFTSNFVLVCDDLHLITDPEIYQGIDFLLEHLTPTTHLVLLTRVDPPIALSRYRVRRQLTEIREQDLRFTAEETESFLNDMMSLNLSADVVAALRDRTEGWIAGLQLAALSMQGREDLNSFIAEFTGSHHYIVDYLVDEVLNRQPDSIREFLLKTSILERMTGSLCDALTGRTDGQAMLELLTQSNLFLIPLDDERLWYRYHHLFSDMLQNQLRKKYGDDITQLHHKAAEWYEQTQYTRYALDHALAANDFTHAAQLFYNDWMEWIGLYNLSANLNYLHRIPASVVRSAPRFSLISVWMAWSSGKVQDAETQVSITQKMIAELLQSGEFHIEDSDFQSLTADLNVLKSLIATHKHAYPLAIELAESAIHAIPKDELIMLAAAYFSLCYAYQELGEFNKLLQTAVEVINLARLSNNSSVSANAFRYLAETYKTQGRLHEAHNTYQQALEYAKVQGQDSEPPYNIIYLSFADLLYEWDDLITAEGYLSKGMKLIEEAGFYVNLLWASPISAKIKRARGDLQGAVDELRQIVSMAKHDKITLFASQAEAYYARLRLENGHSQDAHTWINSLNLARDDRLGYEQSIAAIQCAYILYKLGRSDEALSLLEWIETASRTSNNVGSLLEALILQALIWHDQGNLPQAVERLKNALILAEPEGYVRTFLDYDEPMCALLRITTSSLKDQTLYTYAQKLLTAYVDEPRRQQMIEPADITPISERELEVLHLIAAGKTNQEIANELVIALGTVKRHTFNIYTKLDVKNRTECVAQARLLHLLE